MSVTVRFRLVDKGKVKGEQVQEYDNLQLAESEQYDSMDPLDIAHNPGSRWVDMQVIGG